MWVALPFFLTGLAFLVFGKEIAAAIFGLPALAFLFYSYRWASRPARELRRNGQLPKRR